MAGLPTPDPTVENAQATIASLDEARNQLRGIQKGSIKSLFDYDKALSDRYSSPDSKMYIEHAGQRERLISGYAGTAREDINNLYDLAEKVRSAKEDLQKLLDKTKASSGSGGGFSPSDLLQLGGMDEDIPEPPRKMVEMLASQPENTIYHLKSEDGTDRYMIGPKGQAPEGWRDYYAPKLGDTVAQLFGIDKQTLSKLAALEAINPKLAKATLNSLLTSGVKPTELTQIELEAGVSEQDTVTQRNTKVQQYLQSKRSNNAETEDDFRAYLEAAKQKGYTRGEILTLLEPSFQKAELPGEWKPIIDEIFPSEGGLLERARRAGAAIFGGK